MKIYQVVGCLDEGVSRSWHFRAETEWHVAEFIARNYQNYPDLFDDLGIEVYSRYGDAEPITAEVILNAIDESHIDGDSAYGYEIFEMEESDIITTDNAHLNPPKDYEDFLFTCTGDKHFPYRKFALFHQMNFYALDKFVKINWNRMEKEGSIEYFEAWLAKYPELNQEEEKVLKALSEKAVYHRNYSRGFETLAKFAVPLMNLAAIDNHNYKVFYDTVFEGTINKFFVKGRIDMCIGKGWYEPHNIDFIVHHTHAQDHLGHPLSTLIAKLLAALYEFDRQEIKGAYVMHSTWHFVGIEKTGEHEFRLYESYQYTFREEKFEDTAKIYRFIKAFHKAEEKA
jgi:hypothetical protein